VWQEDWIELTVQLNASGVLSVRGYTGDKQLLGHCISLSSAFLSGRSSAASARVLEQSRRIGCALTLKSVGVRLHSVAGGLLLLPPE